MPGVKALGTLQKKSYTEIKPGQIAEFVVLLWSLEPVEIELKEKTVPKDWMVMVEPKNFILDNNITSSEVVSLQGEYVKALPVEIFVIAPEDAKPGIYEIVINMIAGRSERGISFFQEKNFNFKVNISSRIIGVPTNESISKPVSKTGNFTIPIKVEKIDLTKLIFWSIIMVVFLLIGWSVYRL